MGVCDRCGCASGAGRKGDAPRSEQNRPPEVGMETFGKAGCPLDAEQTWGHWFLVACYGWIAVSGQASQVCTSKACRPNRDG